MRMPGHCPPMYHSGCGAMSYCQVTITIAARAGQMKPYKDEGRCEILNEFKHPPREGDERYNAYFNDSASFGGLSQCVDFLLGNPSPAYAVPCWIIDVSFPHHPSNSSHLAGDAPCPCPPHIEPSHAHLCSSGHMDYSTVDCLPSHTYSFH